MYGQCTRSVRVHGPCTGVHVYTAVTQPFKAVYMTIFGPCIRTQVYTAVCGPWPRKRPRTCPFPGRVRAGYGRVRGCMRAVYTAVPGRVHRHVHGRSDVYEQCTAVYTGTCRVPGRFLPRTLPVRFRATVVYTVRVHLYTCTRPLRGRNRP